MKKSKKIIICALSIVIVISTIVLVMLIKNVNNSNIENQTINEVNDNEEDNVIAQEKIDELKDDLGKGKNGDVVDVIEGQDENKNKTYTYVHEDGSSQTITIRKAKEGEQSGVIESGDIENKEEDDEQTSDPEPPKEEELGTVYEKFMAMSASEQSSFYKSFENPEDFYTWFDKAEEEYNRLHPQIVVGKDEVIDFGN